MDDKRLLVVVHTLGDKFRVNAFLEHGAAFSFARRLRDYEGLKDAEVHRIDLPPRLNTEALHDV